MLAAIVVLAIGLLGLAVVAKPKEAEPSNEDLMVRYQQGDFKSFEVLYRRHRKGVFNFLLRYLGDQSGAEEAMQEVFVRVVKSSAGYQRNAKFTTWLYTIARNLTIDAHRRGKIRQHVSLNQPVGGGDEPLTLEGLLEDKHIDGDGEGRAGRMQIKNAIREGIDALSDEQREVFLLRESAGLQFKEIAVTVGCPENTAKSRM